LALSGEQSGKPDSHISVAIPVTETHNRWCSNDWLHVFISLLKWQNDRSTEVHCNPLVVICNSEKKTPVETGVFLCTALD
jgi:hypothetical protein